jgi:hypothetical protein
LIFLAKCTLRTILIVVDPHTTMKRYKIKMKGDTLSFLVGSRFGEGRVGGGRRL